jgi:DNA-binding response OmpR family regulator
MNSVLILEDDPLIAGAMASLVEDSLDCTVHLAAAVSEAVSLIEGGLKFALLDVEVADGKSFPLAALMLKHKIPCVFVSATKPNEVPAELESVPFLRKPVPPNHLLAAVRRHLTQSVARRFHFGT